MRVWERGNDVDIDLIPAAMVEAAARALWSQSVGLMPKDWEICATDPDDWREQVRPLLAAALGVCDVREEEGGRCARDGDVFGQPGRAFSARSWLATRSYSQPDAHLIRRLVITTPAQPVTEGETDGS